MKRITSRKNSIGEKIGEKSIGEKKLISILKTNSEIIRIQATFFMGIILPQSGCITFLGTSFANFCEMVFPTLKKNLKFSYICSVISFLKLLFPLEKFAFAFF